MNVIDLYAGPGGWDIAARTLDINPVGIERDNDTCRTRSAAGLPTIQADLLEFQPDALNIGTLDGLIASPPCPAFSAAGDGRGRAALPELCDALDTAGPEFLGLEAHHVIDSDPEVVGALVQPVAWLAHYRPRWAAFEQVPPVLPFWEAIARWLESEGWHTWTGIVNAADYGVPQTRRRAILLANRDRPVSAPPPTHAEFPQPTLFGDAPKPWVSMADALYLPGGLLDQCEHGGRSRDCGKPSPTVQGDSRIWPPGHKINQNDIDRLGETEARARYGDRAGTEAIRVTPAEAATLQTFPDDYPFQGSKSSQAKQIGNAVPPLLARHLLAEATR